MRRRAQPVPSRPTPRAPPRRAELVSWKPRAILLHGFLTHAECDHVIAVASPELQRSSVVAAEGGSKIDSIRTRRARAHACVRSGEAAEQFLVDAILIPVGLFAANEIW